MGAWQDRGGGVFKGGEGLTQHSTLCFINLKTEAVVRRCSVGKMLLAISQNSQENACARASFFNKVVCLRPATLLKRDSGTDFLREICFQRGSDILT